MPKLGFAYRNYARGILNWDGFVADICGEAATVDVSLLVSQLPSEIALRLSQSSVISNPPVDLRNFPIVAACIYVPGTTNEELNAESERHSRGAWALHKHFYPA